MSNANPNRKCGTKKENSFYLECAMGAGGALSSWTWLLSDGIDEVITIKLPPRSMTVINPIATIVEREIVLADESTDRYNSKDEKSLLYEHLRSKTRDLGIGDHVGSDNYSPHDFAEEVRNYGPSRKVSRLNAETYALILKKYGPFPIMFAHSNIPVFRDKHQRDKAIALGMGIDDRYWHNEYVSTWRMLDWGQYVRKDQVDGRNQYIVRFLEILDKVRTVRATPENQDAYIQFNAFMKGVTFMEQPFGLSWITKISYTLPSSGILEDESILKIPGIKILDLSLIPEQEA